MVCLVQAGTEESRGKEKRLGRCGHSWCDKCVYNAIQSNCVQLIPGLIENYWHGDLSCPLWTKSLIVSGRYMIFHVHGHG